MKQFRLSVVVCCFLLGAAISDAATPVEMYGQLHIQGNQLLSQDGRQVQLVGEALAWSQWFGSYWNAGCVNWLVTDWKCTIIRAAMGVDGSLGGYLSNPAQKTLLKTVVQACIDNGIYVIIDWHVEGQDPFETQSIAFFKEMAQTYGGYPNVIYEIWNEPHGPDVNPWSMIKTYAEHVTAAIRAIDPDNIILVGTPQWDRAINLVGNDTIASPNIGYVYHFYAASDGASERTKVDSMADKIPIFVTEWSTSLGTGDGTLDLNSGDQWLAILDEHKISWTNWCVSGKAESSNVTFGAGTGNWSASDLSQAGTWTRNKILSYPYPTPSSSVITSLRHLSAKVKAGHMQLFTINGKLKTTPVITPGLYIVNSFAGAHAASSAHILNAYR